MRTVPGVDFAARLYALARSEAFPFPLPAGELVEVIQTHASAVLLAGDRVYKLKKPENFGFFDYSTPAQRRHFCSEEVRLNARLAPHVYLGVAPILASDDGSLRFGPTLGLGDLPLPGARFAGAAVVDYAVVMRRLPEDATLASRVGADRVSPELLIEVAHRIAAFHTQSQTDKQIASFGALEVIAGNWEENIAQIQPYVVTYDRIVAYVRSFIERRAPLFALRVRGERIRDCHGDLRMQHIYALDSAPGAPPGAPPGAVPDSGQITIIDCIEFNERFRYSDIAAELAFLTMELDAAARPDLARAFVDAYIADTRDDELRELLPFYACYRACVRGKVLAFQLDEREVPEEQRKLAQQQAAALFELAAWYAGSPVRPALVLVGGLMGTGKSTLAEALRTELGWPVFSSDAARKRLAQRDLTQPDASGFGAGIYSPAWTARTYGALLDDAKNMLADGRSVILDATFSSSAARHNAADLATALGAGTVFVECACPKRVALARLGRRWAARVAREPSGASPASDGRPELYDAQRSAWEPFDQATEPGIMHLIVATDRPLAVSVAAVLDELRIPRLICWQPAS